MRIPALAGLRRTLADLHTRGLPHATLAALLRQLPGFTVIPVTEADDAANIPAESRLDPFNTRRRDPQPVDQAPLFAADELLIPESLRQMRKAVAAIHAVPSKPEHAHSLNGLRLFDALILVAQLDYRKRSAAEIEEMRLKRISPIFEVRVTELVRLAGIPGKNYERIYEELGALYEMDLTWNVVGESADVEYRWRAHFLSSLGIGEGDQRGLIRFSMDPSVLAIIQEPSNWATLSLRAKEGLRTASSYSLYQQAFRYVGTTSKMTAALPVEVWVELLTGNSGYLKRDAQGKVVSVNYSDFKRRVLLDAIRRVNDLPMLGYRLELKEIRSGTRIARLQFKLLAKQQESLPLPPSWGEDVQQALGNLGYSSAEMEDLSQSYSQEVIAEALVRLGAAEKRKAELRERVTSRKAYFAGILSNLTAGGDSKIEHVDDAQVDSEVRRAEAQRIEEERKARLEAAFAAWQKDRFAQNLFGLPKAERDRILSEFIESPAGAAAKLLLEKRGWEPSNVGALRILQAWLTKDRADLLELVLPNSEDRTLEAWMAWRADQAEAQAAGGSS